MVHAFLECPSATRLLSGPASSASGGVSGSLKMEGLLGAGLAGSAVATTRLAAPLPRRATRSAGSSFSGHANASNRVKAQAAPSAAGSSVTVAAASAVAAPPSEAQQVLRRDGPASGVFESPEGALSADVDATLASSGDCCTPPHTTPHTTLGSAAVGWPQEGPQKCECGTQVAGLKAGLWPAPSSLPVQAEVSSVKEDVRTEGASSDSLAAMAERPRKGTSASARRQAKKTQEPRAEKGADRWRRDGPRTKLLQRIVYEEGRSRDGRVQAREDRSHTSAARALTFCLRGVQTAGEVGSVVRGAESALSMPVISSCLSKLGSEGNTAAAVSLLRWLREENGAVTSSGESQAPQPLPDMAQGGAEHQPTSAPHEQTGDGATAHSSETEVSSEPARRAGKQGPWSLGAPNVFTYNALLGALRTNREWERMDSVLSWMQEDGVAMDTVTLNTFLAAYLDLGKEDVAWDVLAKATATAEPSPDLFTVRTMVPALLRWSPKEVAPESAMGPANSTQSVPGLREGAAVSPRGATAEESGGETDREPETMMPKGYQEWEAQWRRLHLLLGIFKGTSEALGVGPRQSRQGAEGGASQSPAEALATEGGVLEAQGAAPPGGADGALSDAGVSPVAATVACDSAAGAAEYAPGAAESAAGAPEFAAGASDIAGGAADSAAANWSSPGPELGLSELPPSGEDICPTPAGTPGSQVACKGQSVQGPRHRRGRQRQQQQEVEGALRVACSRMVRAVVLLHERDCQQGLAPQPQSQLLPGAAATTVTAQAQAKVAGTGAEDKSAAAVFPDASTPIVGGSSVHLALEEPSLGAPAVLGTGGRAESGSPGLVDAKVGAPQPRVRPAEDPRSRLWAGAAVAVAEAMAGAGVRRDGPTLYWLLKALCVSPGAQQKRIRALYHEMREQRYMPQLSLCHRVLEAMGTAKRWWAALEVYEDMGRRGPQPTEETTALLRAHFNLLLNAARKRRIWKWALLLLRRMQAAGVAPDRRSWATALVTCATANATEAAVVVFRSMVEAGHAAGAREYGALLSALEKGRQWAQAQEVWAHMARVGVLPGLQNYTTMIAVLGAQGLYGKAVELFEEMRTTKGLKPDAPAYNALISACAVAGEGTRAVTWIQKMEEAGVQPDHVSYEQAAAALCNQGQWQSARALLDSMGMKGLQLSQRCEAILEHCTHQLVHNEPAHQLRRTDPAQDEVSPEAPEAPEVSEAGELGSTAGALPPAGPKELLPA